MTVSARISINVGECVCSYDDKHHFNASDYDVSVSVSRRVFVSVSVSVLVSVGVSVRVVVSECTRACECYMLHRRLIPPYYGVTMCAYER